MEIRFDIDKEFIRELGTKLGEQKTTKITKEALTLLNWAVNEIQNNRVILSSNEEGEDIKQLAMPGFEKIKKQGR